MDDNESKHIYKTHTLIIVLIYQKSKINFNLERREYILLVHPSAIEEIGLTPTRALRSTLFSLRRCCSMENIRWTVELSQAK